MRVRKGRVGGAAGGEEGIGEAMGGSGAVGMRWERTAMRVTWEPGARQMGNSECLSRTRACD